MICGLIWMKADKDCCLSADAFLHFQWNSYSLKTIRGSDLTVSLWFQYRAYWQLTHWTHLVVNYNTVEIWHLWGNHRQKSSTKIDVRRLHLSHLHHMYSVALQCPHVSCSKSGGFIVIAAMCRGTVHSERRQRSSETVVLWQTNTGWHKVQVCKNRTMQTHNSAKD